MKVLWPWRTADCYGYPSCTHALLPSMSNDIEKRLRDLFGHEAARFGMSRKEEAKHERSYCVLWCRYPCCYVSEARRQSVSTTMLPPEMPNNRSALFASAVYSSSKKVTKFGAPKTQQVRRFMRGCAQAKTSEENMKKMTLTPANGWAWQSEANFMDTISRLEKRAVIRSEFGQQQ
jgi:hypothetical protein